MDELPLFPLHTVLFPGVPLHLHIFEERYKRMMHLCIETHQPFGVVLIRRGAEALGPIAEPYEIGCSAQITQVQRLDQGRLNITALGSERFRILSLIGKESPYLVGNVEPYPVLISDRNEIKQTGQQLSKLLERYLKLLSEAGQSKLDRDPLPANPVSLAYLSAAMLQVAPVQKQALLEKEQAEDLLVEVLKIYRREVALLVAMLKRQVGKRGAFSSN